MLYILYTAIDFQNRIPVKLKKKPNDFFLKIKTRTPVEYIIYNTYIIIMTFKCITVRV